MMKSNPVDGKQMWTTTKARVEHFCMRTSFARGCGRRIEKGETYARSTYRVGLDALELCMECAEAQDAFSETNLR
jgi:hypothetical protein